MNVIDSEPSGWFLLRDGERLLLDVNCSHSAVSYEFSMQLNQPEAQAYAAGGHNFISELAEKIQYSGPGVIGNVSPYRERQLQGADRTKMNEVILSWVKEHHDAF